MLRTLSRAALPSLLAGALLLSSPPADLAGQAVTLRYGFAEGMDLRYEMVQTSTTELPGMGALAQEQRQFLRMEVLSVDAEGNARLRQTIERIVIDLNSPMGSQSWDSEDASAPPSPEFGGIAAMVGQGLTFTLRPDGSPMETDEVDGWLGRVLADTDPELREMLEATVGSGTIEDLITQSFQPLGSGPVSPGEGWEHVVEIPLPFGRMTSTTIYTLDRVETIEGRRIAILSVSGQIGELVPEAGNPMAGLIQMQGGDIRGEMRFDLDGGILVGSHTETSLQMATMGQALSSVNRVEMRLLP